MQNLQNPFDIARTRLPGTPEPMRAWTGANGVRIAGDVWGAESAPLVVLLHGGGQTRHSWRGTGQELAGHGYRVVAFDARGHGDSAWAADADYSQDAFVRDLACVVDALGDPHPAIIGASLGGNTGLAAVGEGALDASALVLVDVVPKTTRTGFERIQTFMKQKPEGFASLDEVADAVAQYRADGKRPRHNAGLAKNVRKSASGRYFWHWDPQFLATREADLALRHARLSRAARRLRAPTLLVRGASSDVVTDEGVAEFLDLCPHAEYVNIEAAGHMVAGDDNDVFGHATAAFLERHLANARRAS
ncbi:Alpha/beta hydrolase fold protein [Paraburkholderia unamae]|uniref:alpha/beta fold hydrolase n=1 Tax=Paraburkholderia unamae TaxID=219649 RepID=UPI001CAB52CF|nr:alpha/beta hydrolase [Paraburkholderia unamae]CAG9274681.1 Alpha/beta hydrolase fold protein [Paraburkholderia unamae]